MQDTNGITLSNNQIGEKKRKIKKNIMRRTAKYLGGRKDELKDKLRWERHSKIPILKNGCRLFTNFSVNGREIYFKSTCSFDSISQLTVLAAQDHPQIFDTVRIYIHVTL